MSDEPTRGEIGQTVEQVKLRREVEAKRAVAALTGKLRRAEEAIEDLRARVKILECPRHSYGYNIVTNEWRCRCGKIQP